MSAKRGGTSSTKQSDLQTPLLPAVSGSWNPENLEDVGKASSTSRSPTTTGDPNSRKREKDAKLATAPTVTTSPSTQEISSGPRQVIAVSASKGPTAFFNLARKFLVTDEMCDLSALEGAIVSAVDAAHLLERSKLATIVRVQTSYVSVEPKRKKATPGTPPLQSLQPILSQGGGPTSFQSGESPSISSQHGAERQAGGRELRRARIVITVQRTASYKQWLEENPLQAIISEHGDDEHDIVDNIQPDP